MPQNNQSHNSRNSGTVNLAQKAAGKRTSAPGPKKKSKTPKNRNVIIGVLVTVIVLMLVFLIVGGIKVYETIAAPKNNVKQVTLTSHDTTPADFKDKVAYYVVGLLGEEVKSPTDMLSILCWDKQNNTVNILQIPQDTYLGDSGQWAVKRAADVWGNPKPLDWCTTDRRQVPKAEIKDGKHTVCGTAITKKTGSAPEDLCDVFNDQYGLPVDGYFLFPQQALVKLVNLLGGLDVNLESAMTVEDIDYSKGVQTLDGSAALYYATYRKSGITGDVDRLVRQRRVFLALFQRLTRQSGDRLSADFIGPLMNGSTPIRTNFTRAQLIQLIQDMSNIPPSSMTAVVLPGKTGKAGGKTYFAADKASLLTLFNQSFHPYGTALTEEDLGLTPLGSGKVSDIRKQVLSEIAVPQSGAVATTAASTTATDAS